MRRKNIGYRLRRCAGMAVGLAAAAAIVAVPVAAAGCGRKTASVEVESASEEASQPAAEEETAAEETFVSLSQGDAGSMVETEEALYFKYDNSIWAIDKKTDKMRKLLSFDEENWNSTFWAHQGSLYFDREEEAAEGAALTGLYKLDVESGEESHLADLTGYPTAIYVSEDRLYVRCSSMNVVYSLDKEGKTAGELSPEETVYSRIPDGCRELYGGLLPYYVDHYGYMPVQNDNCLVIAAADGSGSREVPEVTNTSSVFFGEGCFFAMARDGSGGTECWRYDAETLDKKLVFQSDENPILLQYRDGYLYYFVEDEDQTLSGEKNFYRVPENGGDSEALLEMKTEPGMTDAYDAYGKFYVAGNGIYCQEMKDYGLYMGRREAGEGSSLLTPVLYQSPIREIGHVEAEHMTIPCACGEYTAVLGYIEKLVVDGEGEEAAAINECLEEDFQRSVAYVGSMVSAEDEEWIHQMVSPLTYTSKVVGLPYISDSLFCVEMDGYEYTGGAHGMPFREYYVFDRKTGGRLGLEDIVENSQEELQSMVGAAFRKLAEETNFAFESPEELEHTVSDDISYASPFYLTEEGLVFYYTPYAIAPYAEGFPQVVIPYEELSLKIEL